MNKINTNKKERISQYFINMFITFYSLFCLVPVVLVFMVSITDERTINMEGYSLIPKEFSLKAYEQMLYPGSPLFRSYGISILVTVVGTLIAVVITFLAAYPLANKEVKYRNVFALYFFITTVFNTGLVPFYLMSRSLNMYDNIWALIIPNMVFQPFNLFLVRNFIKEIPYSLMESAKLDGAGELRIAFQVYFPLCKSVLATITLFYGIAYWNNWFNAVMLLDNTKLYPLQMLLFKIQSDISMLTEVSAIGMKADPPKESFKFATVIVTVGPIILLYPFLQQYFVKGIIMGSIKG